MTASPSSLPPLPPTLANVPSTSKLSHRSNLAIMNLNHVHTHGLAPQHMFPTELSVSVTLYVLTG